MRTLLRRVFGQSKREMRDRIAQLEGEARRYYRSDGTFTVMPPNVDVVGLRVLAARENKSMREEIERLKPKAEEGDRLLSQEIDRLNDELDTLSHRFAAHKFENDRLAGENDALKEQLGEHAKASRASRQRIEGLITENEAYQDRLEKAADAYAAKNEEIRREWEKVVEPLRTENNRLRVQLAESEQEAESRETYVRLLADEKERLRQRVVSLREELDAVVATASETAAELKGHRDALKDLGDECIKANASRDKAWKLLGDANEKLTEAESEADGLNGYFDNIDKQISETLEKVGRFPGKPAGAPDRVDVICAAVVELEAENKRLTRMLTEPEFLRAETERVGGIVTTSADLKHWAASAMVKSLADSLGGDRAVELTLGNEEHGRFVVTIREDDGRSLIDEVNDAGDKIRKLEIALEASDQLEQEWKGERAEYEDRLDRLRRAYRKHKDAASKYAEAYTRATHAGDVAREERLAIRREAEHVKNVCASLRERCDALAHALIGLSSAVEGMKVSHPIPAGDHVARWVRLERAVAEADRVLGSEPSAA